MPILYKDGLSIFFFHIPKCAGTSIEKIFIDNGYSMELHNSKHAYKPLSKNFKCSPQHYHYEMASHIVDLSSFDYCFAIVRDPIDRLISEYKMRSKHHSDPLDFTSWLRRIYSLYTKNSFVLDNHIRPQHEFLGPEVNTFNLNFGLSNVFEKIQSDLGVNIFCSDQLYATHGSELSKVKVNKHDLKSEDLELIQKIYALDMEMIK